MKRIIAIMSGKGGVGKSTISCLTSILLSRSQKVLLIDFDLTGPSLQTVFNLTKPVIKSESGFLPSKINENLYVLTIASIIRKTDVVIWRGAKKLVMLKMFLDSITDELVVIDMPPGLTEEHQLLVENKVDVILVTTPQNVALSDTENTIEYCRKNNMNIIGLIENMAGYRCTNCDKINNIFARKGGEMLANEYEIPLLASLKLDTELTDSMDNGQLVEYIESTKNYDELEKILNSALNKKI